MLGPSRRPKVLWDPKNGLVTVVRCLGSDTILEARGTCGALRRALKLVLPPTHPLILLCPQVKHKINDTQGTQLS